jgi:hypothetical protein
MTGTKDQARPHIASASKSDLRAIANSKDKKPAVRTLGSCTNRSDSSDHRRRGCPPILVYEDPDGILEICDGVTRAIRIAKLAPGQTVPIVVIGQYRTEASGQVVDVGPRRWLACSDVAPREQLLNGICHWLISSGVTRSKTTHHSPMS